MKFVRTYKQESLKFGTEDIVDESTLRTIFYQADIYLDGELFSVSGDRRSFNDLCDKLLKTKSPIVIGTYFSEFRLQTT